MAAFFWPDAKVFKKFIGCGSGVKKSISADPLISATLPKVGLMILVCSKT